MAAAECDKARPSYVDFNVPKQPITGLSWFHAKKHCEARGKRPPSAAQRGERAARDVDGRRYP